jgi:hypothetical protein
MSPHGGRAKLKQRQQHHYPPSRLPPLPTQASSQPLGFPGRAAGVHADQPHADHSLAGALAPGQITRGLAQAWELVRD